MLDYDYDDDRLTASEIEALETCESPTHFKQLIDAIKLSRGGRSPEDLSSVVFGDNGVVVRLRRRFEKEIV